MTAHHSIRREGKGGRCLKCDLNLTFINERDLVYLAHVAVCTEDLMCPHGDDQAHWYRTGLDNWAWCDGPQLAPEATTADEPAMLAPHYPVNRITPTNESD